MDEKSKDVIAGATAWVAPGNCAQTIRVEGLRSRKMLATKSALEACRAAVPVKLNRDARAFERLDLTAEQER